MLNFVYDVTGRIAVYFASCENKDQIICTTLFEFILSVVM